MKNFFLLTTFMFLTVCVFAQDRAITGKVTNSKGEPVPFASVLIKGTTNGNTTDFNGVFKLTNVPVNAILVISCMDFKTKEINTGSKAVVDIVLEESSIVLEAVQVTGYTKQKKSDVTGAVSSISNEDIQKVPVHSIEKSLQGQSAGVQVTSNSGKPGGDVMIRIRGVGTFGSAKPLFIVDGVSLDDLTTVNPNDVASMEILKDASSTAIYGARGANGVVIISTKKGAASKTGKPSVSYDMYMGYQQPWKLLDLANAQEWAEMRNTAFANSSLPSDPPNFRNTPVFSDPASLGEGTNWQKEIFQSAPMMSHNISIAGGTEKHTYNSSLLYYKQDGIIKGTNFDKINFSLSNTNIINDKLNITTKIGFYHGAGNNIEEQNEYGGPLMGAVMIDPVTPLYDSVGNYNATAIGNTPNPANLIKNTYKEWHGISFTGNTILSYKPIKDVEFVSKLGLEKSYYDWTNFTPSYYLASDDVNSARDLERGVKNLNNWNWENLGFYRKEFKEKHNVLVMVGMAAESHKYPTLHATIKDMPNNNVDMRYLTFGDPTSTIVSEDKYQWSLFSYFARVEYSFLKRYLLTANIRKDGSSRFGDENKFASNPFPSATIGWKLSEERFMKKIKWINQLKIRAGYGVVGNQDIGQSNTETLVTVNKNNYILGTTCTETTSGTIGGFPDKNIIWEKISSLNLGIDASLFNNKIEFSGNYFTKKTEDMLVEKPIAKYLGMSNPWVNGGDLMNKGFEIELKYRDKINDVIEFMIAPNFTHIINEVTNMGETDAKITSSDYRNMGYVSYTMTGYPVASFYGYKTDGVFKTDEEAANYVNANGDKLEPAAKAGDIKFLDIDGDGKITNDDRTVIGNPWPKYTFGLNLSASYKNWDIDILMQGVYGNKIFNGMKSYSQSGTITQYNASKDLYDNYSTPDRPTDEYVALRETDLNNNYRLSDWYLEDGSYLRFRNVQISYRLPESVINKLKIAGCKLYIRSQNLFTFTKYTGFDPEIGEAASWKGGSLAVGVDRANYPQARSFLGGMQINF